MSMFRRRIMMKQGGIAIEGIPSSEAVAGDVCIYGISEGKPIIVNDWDASKYPINKYPPIGIVVVPGNHGHYEGGKCSIMSLNHMNCSSPTTGGVFQNICWGVKDVDIDTLPNLDQVPYVGSKGNVTNTVIGTSDYEYLPSDFSKFTAVDNPYDPKTKYYYNNSFKYIPSPYNSDETFNSNYSLTDSPSSTANCLSDFDGYNNTKKILAVRGNKDYSSWLPSIDAQEDYPAASCCDMYSTAGITQGSWYLPSAGELGYVCVRRQAIDNSLNKLIQGGVSLANTLNSNAYWSSSEHSSLNARAINLMFGFLIGYNKDVNSCVRAFAIV